MSNYGYAASDLDERWESERNYNGFCHDGILTEDADDYFDGNGPKIVFLLKEPSRAFADIRGNVRGSGELTSQSRGRGRTSFWKMLGMWTYVLDMLWDNDDPDIDEFYEEHHSGGYGLVNVALVNLKKEPESHGRAWTSWSELKRFARRDRVFINEQIDLCAPNIIVCCGTYQVYAEITDGDIPSGPQEEPVWDDVNNRIVIDWRHPARCWDPNENFWAFVNYCRQRSDLF